MLEFMGWQRVRSDLANEQPKFAMQIRKRTAFHAEGTGYSKVSHLAREHGSSKELQERQIMRLKYRVEIHVGADQATM